MWVYYSPLETKWAEEDVMKTEIRKRIRIVRNSVYSRSGGVTLAIQES
jgi:hypothetical protein